ncbi:spore coat CotO family protein [Oceanobacillus caeni]|uniref:CotO family spore coat protein n=1 Tax=Oceanobacillus TaxID=182709 RepID=UPI000621F152|nr:CotO family spore coat protein [Oceanobacillus caeni]KKE79951.1 hypothetical protein WH51_04645 [Bacilli bacterium VT-13-104]PZD83078.1 hypothetical protein DEJ64_16310 [Bacilli bacterium]MCR1835484.1 spore coat CotO family protein [Oceanobacillus caeni]PZD86534.1 hypothetical protein DEJ60_10530 [Bacilli bacterium]PZD90053.1 hypothetical protein DEJ66_10935 [Bacilli bacterium]
MSKGKYANEPLLFIQQNKGITFPMAPMQESYITPKKKAKPKKEVISKGKEPKVVMEEEVTMEDAIEEKSVETPKKKYSSKKGEKDTVDSLDQELVPDEKTETKSEVTNETEEEQQPVRERKQFRDMSIRERVEYFANTSEYAPKMRCEVKTKQRTFRGIIVSFKDEEVTFQSGKRMQQIPFEEIRSVRLLGF